MQGYYFYIFSWMLWIIATFFLNKKNKLRFPIACLLLLIIIFAPFTISIFGFQASLTAIFLLLIALVKVSFMSLRSKFSLFLSSLIIAIGYVTFLLFELFDPVWIIFKREWLLCGLIVVLSSVLQRNLTQRLLIVIIGGVYGETMFSITIHRFSFPYTIGSFQFLDVCALTSIVLIGLTGIIRLVSYFENHHHSIEREKQKTT